MKTKFPHVSIVMLNWNGWQDTLECLETVFRSDYLNYSVILIDNASKDNSVEKIESWLEKEIPVQVGEQFQYLLKRQLKRPIIYDSIALTEKPLDFKPAGAAGSLPSNHMDCILLKNPKNSGFAMGSNLGMQFAINHLGSEFVFLLNNDTVIEPDTLSRLVSHMEEHSDVSVLTSAIFHYNDKDQIANLGGRLTRFGNRQYYVCEEDVTANQVTFATGCALCIRTSLLEDIGLLSEDFFFGEEDFEFALRLQRQALKMDCVVDSKVYHKISASSAKLYSSNVRKTIIHFFNRIINMRSYYSKPFWLLWKYGLMTALWLRLILKGKVGLRKATGMIVVLSTFSNHYQDAKFDTVQKLTLELEQW